MKYRKDFVTNSSSSSFVVAIRKDLTETELEKILIPVIKDQLGDSDEDSIKQEFKRVKKLLFSNRSKPDMDLGDWKIYTALDFSDCDEMYMAYMLLCEVESEFVKGIQS